MSNPVVNIWLAGFVSIISMTDVKSIDCVVLAAIFSTVGTKLLLAGCVMVTIAS